MFVRSCAFGLLLVPALAQATAIQDLAGRQIDRLKAVCTRADNVLDPLAELKAREKPEDWRAYLAFDQLSWADLAHEPACKAAMVENTREGMAFVIANEDPSSNWINMARGQESRALLRQAVSGPAAERDARLAQAEALIATYIAGEAHAKDPKDVARGMAYYFVAHGYLDAAKVAERPEDVDAMLAKALQTARDGMAHATDKSELVEPYGIALGEMAKRATKGSPEWRKAIEESITAFSTVSATDPLAAYNIAVDHVLLDDMPAAKNDLQALADAHRIDDQICVGFLSDKDLEPLRTSDTPWFVGFVKAQCQPTLERVRRQLATMRPQRD